MKEYTYLLQFWRRYEPDPKKPYSTERFKAPYCQWEAAYVSCLTLEKVKEWVQVLDLNAPEWWYKVTRRAKYVGEEALPKYVQRALNKL